MHLRIASRVNHLGRRFYVEKEINKIFGSVWENVGSTIGYDDEKTAREAAEEYAKGDWISDSAHFGAMDTD